MTETGKGPSTGRTRGTRNYVAKPAVCPFCKGSAKIDYKDVLLLSRYISGQGKMLSRRRNKTCAKHQRRLAQAIKRARYLAMLPYAPTHIWKTGGVGLSHSSI